MAHPIAQQNAKLSQSSDYIEAFPRFQLRDCIRGNQGTLSEYSGLYSSGRAAIYWALKRLQLRSGAAVWMPAFHCGVEIDAAIKAGAKVHFYRITEQLSVDLEDLQRGLESQPGPVLVIHYFGFPQPEIERLVSICSEAGVPLIEDCAHSLFSSRCRTSLGSFGILSVFSFPKSLPVVEGGALRVNSEALRANVPDEELRLSMTPYKVYAKTWLRPLLPGSFVRWYQRRSQPAAGCSDEFANSSLPFGYCDRPSLPTIRIVAAQRATEILRSRRENWNLLHMRLSQTRSYMPVFSSLQEGICPLVLPIWVGERPELVYSLQQRGIATFIFGRLPHRLQNDAQRVECQKLRDHILGLPVHQQLTSADMRKLAEETITLLPKHTFSGL